MSFAIRMSDQGVNDANRSATATTTPSSAAPLNGGLTGQGQGLTMAKPTAFGRSGSSYAEVVERYDAAQHKSAQSNGEQAAQFVQNQAANYAINLAWDAAVNYLGLSTAGGTAGVAAAGGASAGAGVAAAEAGAAAAGGATGAAAGSSAAGAAAAAWPALVAYAAIKGFQNYQANEKWFKDGTVTDKEIDSVFQPDLFGEQELNPLHDEMVKFSLGHQIWRAIFGSGKHEDQLMRDRVRGQLKEIGVIDANNLIHNPDGSTFDIGVDGGNPQYQLNEKNPMASEFVTMIYPVTMMLTGGNEKLAADFTGYFINAAMAGKGGEDFDVARTNLSAIMEKAGITPELALQYLSQAHEAGAIDDQQLQVYTVGLDTMINGIQSEAQLEDVTSRVAAREQFIAQLLAQDPEMSMVELSKRMMEFAQNGYQLPGATEQQV